MKACRLVREPYDDDVVAALAALHVDHAVAVLLEGEDGRAAVGYTMCHPAGPKSAPLRCGCAA